ncbi:MAG: RNA polymerase sigma factor [Pseudomonadales bacterium]|jgi:RNA polymerase sigma-70 factor (ECF subfamily)|nr:RNA polymerase sigma factor [Pseudomonadales bacterium]
MNADALRRELLALLPRLRRYAYALTGVRHDADDLLQATLERLLVKGVPEAVDVDKWSFRVCRNMWIDEIRARRVRSAVPFEESGAMEQTFDGENALMSKLGLAEISDAMQALPEEQRAALSLVVLEGLSYAQAAEVLETPIGTIMSRIARARAALSKALRVESVPIGAGLVTGAGP